jgi:anti-sigma factor RsiW
MTCREFAEFLIDYVSGELPEPTRGVFQAHVAVCRDCRNYLDSYRKTIALSKTALAEPTVDVAAMPEGLVRAILAARRAGGGSDAASS